MPLGSAATRDGGFNKDHKVESKKAQKSRSIDAFGKPTALSVVAANATEKLGPMSDRDSNLQDRALKGDTKAGKQLDEVNYVKAMNRIKSRRSE